MYYQRDPVSYKARAAANNARTKAENRQRLREYLSMRACISCGIRDIAVLEFDHRDAKSKRSTVSRLIGQAISWRTILAEIEKCDVMCANCHRRRTARQFGWRKLLGLEPVLDFLE
jgi:hypothetical protein